MKKPRLALVSSHNASCANAYFVEAIQSFLEGSFDVEIIDLKSYELLTQADKSFYKSSEAYIDSLCERLADFDVVNIHLELILFGRNPIDQIRRVHKLCQASKRLILTVYRIELKGLVAFTLRVILANLKKRPSTNPYHLLVHLPREKKLIETFLGIEDVTDFPVLLLNEERRKQFQKLRNQSHWKQKFGLKDDDKTIGFFGLIGGYKNYPHALKTLKLLPENYKLLIIGEVHPMNMIEGEVASVLQELLDFLDENPGLSHRVIFTGRRDDQTFNEDLVNVDFVLIPYYEVGQSGTAALGNALELNCPVLMSNTLNCREYQNYFPNCFEVFDIGNYYETKHKILHFDKSKLENLRNRLSSFSGTQYCKIYESIYATMEEAISTTLPLENLQLTLFERFITANSVRRIYKMLPESLRNGLKKELKKTLTLG